MVTHQASYLKAEHPELLETIRTTKALPGTDALDGAMTTFKGVFAGGGSAGGGSAGGAAPVPAAAAPRDAPRDAPPDAPAEQAG